MNRYACSPRRVAEPRARRVPLCQQGTRLTHMILDIDGDGTPNLLVRADEGWLHLHYDSGVITWRPVGFRDWGNSQQGDGLRVGDYNGDGLTDIMKVGIKIFEFGSGGTKKPASRSTRETARFSRSVSPMPPPPGHRVSRSNAPRSSTTTRTGGAI